MPKLLYWVAALSTVGTFFAGTVTLRTLIAPASQPGLFSCVGLKVLGLSPCPFGLGLFALLAAYSWYLVKGTLGTRSLLTLRLIAAAGLTFSGWVAWRELFLPALTLGSRYWETFQLARVPACVWGFLVFLASFALTLNLEPPARPRT